MSFSSEWREKDLFSSVWMRYKIWTVLDFSRIRTLPCKWNKWVQQRGQENCGSVQGEILVMDYPCSPHWVGENWGHRDQLKVSEKISWSNWSILVKGTREHKLRKSEMLGSEIVWGLVICHGRSGIRLREGEEEVKPWRPPKERRFR